MKNKDKNPFIMPSGGMDMSLIESYSSYDTYIRINERNIKVDFMSNILGYRTAVMNVFFHSFNTNYIIDENIPFITSYVIGDRDVVFALIENLNAKVKVNLLELTKSHEGYSVDGVVYFTINRNSFDFNYFHKYGLLDRNKMPVKSS